MAPNLSTIERGPVPTVQVCNNCGTPAGRHHFNCFRCPAMAAVLNAAERAKFRVTDNAAHADQVQRDRSAL